MIEHAYIHIPFCLRKCRYCSFVSGISIEYKNIYLNALDREINSIYKREKLKTLYIGGGTPSLLNAEDILNIIQKFNLYKDAEITIEANPETVYPDKFKDYKDAGINRVSLGIQTFNNGHLQVIGRNHTGIDAENAVSTIKSAGFNNISTDLIYGLPNQTLDDFEKDLKTAVQLDIQHISAYGLKIEEGSFFYNNKPCNLPDDEMQAEMYNYMCRFLDNLNFNHYEISSFALDGFKSKHNCAYWLNKEYYGFGAGASGFKNSIRYKNISDFKEYINNPFKKEEEIKLTEKEMLENEIFLSLRLHSGIDINSINKKYNIDFNAEYGRIIQKYEQFGLLTRYENRISLTQQGMLLSSEIMSEFIDV